MTTALILIDIQNDYFPGGRMELEGSPEAALQAADLLACFRTRGLPVFHVQHLSTRAGATFFIPDTEGAEIHPLVAPAPRRGGRHQALPQQLPGDGAPLPSAPAGSRAAGHRRHDDPHVRRCHRPGRLRLRLRLHRRRRCLRHPATQLRWRRSPRAARPRGVSGGPGGGVRQGEHGSGSQGGTGPGSRRLVTPAATLSRIISRTPCWCSLTGKQRPRRNSFPRTLWVGECPHNVCMLFVMIVRPC